MSTGTPAPTALPVLVVRLNSITPPAWMNLAVVTQLPEETQRRHEAHLANPDKPVFDYRPSSRRTDLVASQIKGFGLKLVGLSVISKGSVRHGQTINLPITVVSYGLEGGYIPVGLPTDNEETAKATALIERWLEKQLDRSWQGSQLWVHGQDQPMVLNLLCPTSLDENHPHIPLSQHLVSHLASRMAAAD